MTAYKFVSFLLLGCCFMCGCFGSRKENPFFQSHAPNRHEESIYIEFIGPGPITKPIFPVYICLSKPSKAESDEMLQKGSYLGYSIVSKEDLDGMIVDIEKILSRMKMPDNGYGVLGVTVHDGKEQTSSIVWEDGVPLFMETLEKYSSRKYKELCLLLKEMKRRSLSRVEGGKLLRHQ